MGLKKKYRGLAVPALLSAYRRNRQLRYSHIVQNKRKLHIHDKRNRRIHGNSERQKVSIGVKFAATPVLQRHQLGIAARKGKRGQ